MSDEKAVILVVDDTPENIDVLSGLLRDQYKVKAAKSGERALKLVEKAKPDLILLDIMMPEMDGFEVCRRLKANAETNDIPVIFISGKNTEQDRKQGLELGAVGYLTKPIDPSNAINLVESFL